MRANVPKHELKDIKTLCRAEGICREGWLFCVSLLKWVTAFSLLIRDQFVYISILITAALNFLLLSVEVFALISLLQKLKTCKHSICFQDCFIHFICMSQCHLLPNTFDHLCVIFVFHWLSYKPNVETLSYHIDDHELTPKSLTPCCTFRTAETSQRWFKGKVWCLHADYSTQSSFLKLEELNIPA